MSESAPNVFVFNAFAEGYIAQGKAFTPVKHQVMLARDLANLPQFLCEPGDVVLLETRPSSGFLKTLEQAGFALPEFAQIRNGRIDVSASPFQRQLGMLRPWAWGPESVELFQSLFARASGKPSKASRYFSHHIAQLYSKVWSANFLRKVLSHSQAWDKNYLSGTGAEYHPGLASASTSWLCSEHEAGVAAGAIDEALEAVATIRGRGHHQVVVKKAFGLAGRNAIRLWEPELLPTQRQWLSHALSNGRQVVVEPWLVRELDFSIQLEMGPRDLRICGYTGLLNDSKGQFLANWAEADYRRCLPTRITGLFNPAPEMADCMESFFGKVFSLLEPELQHAGFVGPVSVDAFVYRTPEGNFRIKPVVEINPRYTMVRLTVELMRNACPGSSGLFRLISQAQARAEGFRNLCDYASSLRERLPLLLNGEPMPKICQGAVCLNDPAQAQVCLATFEVGRTLRLPDLRRCPSPFHR